MLFRSRAQGFADLRAVVEMAVEDMADKDAARELVAGYLKDWEAKLGASGSKGAYDYSKLAAELGGDHFTFAQLARVSRDLGDFAAVQEYLGRAAAACRHADQAEQLARRLAATGFGVDEVRGAYEAAKTGLGDPREQLAWAEGVVNIFGDMDWARKVYDELGEKLGGDEAYRRSRKLRLERSL